MIKLLLLIQESEAFKPQVWVITELHRGDSVERTVRGLKSYPWRWSPITHRECGGYMTNCMGD